jgi:hypothetical protein
MGDIGPTRQRYDVLSSDRDEDIHSDPVREPLGSVWPDSADSASTGGTDGERGAQPQGDAAR